MSQSNFLKRILWKILTIKNRTYFVKRKFKISFDKVFNWLMIYRIIFTFLLKSQSNMFTRVKRLSLLQKHPFTQRHNSDLDCRCFCEFRVISFLTKIKTFEKFSRFGNFIFYNILKDSYVYNVRKNLMTKLTKCFLYKSHEIKNYKYFSSPPPKKIL